MVLEVLNSAERVGKIVFDAIQARLTFRSSEVASEGSKGNKQFKATSRQQTFIINSWSIHDCQQQDGERWQHGAAAESGRLAAPQQIAQLLQPLPPQSACGKD